MLQISLLILPFSILADVVEPSPLTVGIYDNPPQVYRDQSGTPQGIYVDLLREIARLEQWDIDFVWGDWSTQLAAAKAGKLDLITSIAYSKERDRLLDYSQESVVTVWGQLYQTPELEVQNILDLEQQEIAVMKNGFYGNRLAELCVQFEVQCNFLPVSSYRDAMQAVSEGKAGVAVINSLFGYAFEQDFSVKRSSVIFDPLGLRVAATEGRQATILDTIDRYLKRWKSDNNSFYHKIFLKHTGGPIAAQPSLPKWVLWTVGSILLVLIVWFFTLRSQKQALEESQSRLQTTLDSSMEGILLVDLQGNILDFNRSFVEIWCLPAERMSTMSGDEAIGLALTQLSNPQPFIDKVKSLYTDIDAISNDEQQFVDGRIIAHHTRPYKTGNQVQGRIWNFLDVTDERKATLAKD
ncbi:MAG: transporter substrate-binding domain-containing protein, partial [Gammaproteobacteria bacterium]|nr:transporter substrate-binding domain-containing protein [Gammaproteobacteria bacterium]